MLFAHFIVMATIRNFQETLFESYLKGYTSKKVKENKTEPPKGYYVCVDCGAVCERKNARQMRCTDCQKKHTRELEREYDKKRKRKK